MGTRKPLMHAKDAATTRGARDRLPWPSSFAAPCRRSILRGNHGQRNRHRLRARAGRAFASASSQRCSALRPSRGELGAAIAELAATAWRHPTTGEAVRFSAKTIERWYYAARGRPIRFGALERKVPQPRRHASERHAAGRRGDSRPAPRAPALDASSSTRQPASRSAASSPSSARCRLRDVCRFMKHHGLLRARRQRRHEQEPGFVPRERRSFEVEPRARPLALRLPRGLAQGAHDRSGERKKPMLFGILDDRSRLCCHLQWYLDESAPRASSTASARRFRSAGCRAR